MSVKSQFIEVGRARLHVAEAGDGPALVFLHAGIADGRMWAPQQASFCDRFRTIAIDRRGFGRTMYAPEPFSPVDDLIAVLDALGIERAVLVGCSMGGRLAIDTALAHPERVRALVLVASSVSGAPQPEAFPPVIRARLDSLEAAEAREAVDDVNELEAQLWLDGPAQAAGRVSGPLRELFLSMNGIALRAVPPGDEIAPSPAWPRLHTLQAPTLVLWGTLDFPHLLDRMEHLVATISGARRHVIDGTAHLPNLEQPQAFDAALGGFLDALEP